MIRLDKFLCEMEIGTRSQVKDMVKKGMVSVDGEVVKKADYKFDETAAKVHTLSPRDAQTGPARRGDENVMNHHLSLLNDEQRQVYQLLSAAIRKR